MLKEGCLLKFSRAHWLLGGQRCTSAQTQNVDKARARHCGRVRMSALGGTLGAILSQCQQWSLSDHSCHDEWASEARYFVNILPNCRVLQILTVYFIRFTYNSWKVSHLARILIVVITNICYRKSILFVVYSISNLILKSVLYYGNLIFTICMCVFKTHKCTCVP